MYLSDEQAAHLARLLRVFFSLPYSTDLDGKDAESCIRTVKGALGPLSKRKELFDIVDGVTGYSVKTLYKPLSAKRVDLQEQRFCDTDEMEALRRDNADCAPEQGRLLLGYMRKLIHDNARERGIEDARSAILLKTWNLERTEFTFRYWEEDLLAYIDDLWTRDQAGKIAWEEQVKGLHGRDPERDVRLIRMHYKHNQIFTDHDIPDDAVVIRFQAGRRSLDELHDLLYGSEVPLIESQAELAAD
jgi:hypothetical protein